METINILVLGVGGNVSQGIIKALQLSSLPLRLVTACISPTSVGLYFGDSAYISPYADDSDFTPWLISVCREHEINVIFSGVDIVLERLARDKEEIESVTQARIIVSSSENLHVFNHKVRTCQWLSKHGFNFPRFAESHDQPAIKALLSQVGFPLICKPNQGKGSIGVKTIWNMHDLEHCLELEDYIIQEYLGNPEEEYTVGCFCDKQKTVHSSFCLRREIVQGTTSKAFLDQNMQIIEESRRIVKAINTIGPCNVQLRMHQGKAVCFEVNLRYSGTTPMRASLGCNDVDMALRHFVLNEPLQDPPPPTHEIAVVLRYWTEFYVPQTSFRKLHDTGKLDDQDLGLIGRRQS